MMKNISPLEKMLSVSILFNMLLLLVRFYFTQEIAYSFYVWNTFLAVLPLLFSRSLLKLNKFNIKAVVFVVCWLAFFPNAPYMVTDVFHYEEKPPVPKWYDLLIVITAAWNGLLLGIISLMQIERFLTRHLKAVWVKITVMISFVLCGYGIYIGRYLRFNSWDAVLSPGKLIHTFGSHIFKPQEHIMIWGFTLLFGTMFGIIYFTLKQLRHENASY